MEELVKSFVTIQDGSGDTSIINGIVSADAINSFTRIGDHDGSGGGNGSGWGGGSGTCSDNEHTDTDLLNGVDTDDYDGSGYGSGYGSGSGNGMENDGDLLSFARVGNDTIHNINGAPMAIDNIKGNIAKGRILNDDMTFTDCWIVREGNCIEYGKDLHKTYLAAQRESAIQLPKEERLKMFVQRFPSPDEPIPIKELYHWHHVLTGACRIHSKEWCKRHGFNFEDEIYCVSIRRFVNLTESEWGGDIIKELKNYYKDW